ncbi:hypothetical protein F4558_002769 [Micromonospora profundi]|uniref:hypothetical protein n=1 Tax=Micromonospora profundi TaxID=1420889 RepID=UPI00143AFBFF|nr:hypothetical protein [Micromonospora profundi]NJC12943.1 hypothetical protein [Micromonospora profundi]
MKTEMHPIGFRKYILMSFRGYRLRLHVWPDGVGTDSRHNHRWWFVSMPLFGRFLDTRFREVPASGRYLKIDVADRDGVRDGERSYHLKGESDLEVVKRKIRYPLIPYLCRFGEIHSYVPYKPGFHASLVFLGRLRRQTSEIWRDADHLDVKLEPDAELRD